MFVKPLDNEAEILAEIARGDKLAFEILFRNYHKYVLAFSRKITRSDDLAKEIVQDVFLKIWLGREKLKALETFGAYLNTMVRHHCFNALRQLSQKVKSNEVFRLKVSKSSESTAQELDYREAEQILNQAVETLSPQQRMVYILCHQQGMKYEEAAIKMGISPQTVHAYMKDALKKIRAHFKKHAMEYTVFILSLFRS
ncbi:RNA polymerase sigma-70 factor, ECF subfamily [Pedobacter terrae]|uniref:RNA polymerase sigma-70 factor, ECF subfamily n=1 Tax=Pedobacter terrae TaxID=405671 RepID=A0A1G8BTM5_9SPHI|nr:RNA polymerase sigma-70 factor [Pedobacter terrae]SDH36453.1 RNA polymerase sigma-70 factor, ECF subfamily [Pedobacter terrae]